VATALPADSSADQDSDARRAIWNSIGVCGDDVRHRFAIKSVRELDGREIRSGTTIPAVHTWQLIEALSLLCLIIRCDDATASAVNVFGKMGPVLVREDGIARYVSTQHTLKGEKSALSGRPDIIVTTTDETPHPGNAARIIDYPRSRRSSIVLAGKPCRSMSITSRPSRMTATRMSNRIPNSTISGMP